jgi:hypothetical protein
VLSAVMPVNPKTHTLVIYLFTGGASGDNVLERPLRSYKKGQISQSTFSLRPGVNKTIVNSNSDPDH